MAKSTTEVRHEIELTQERMSETIAQLERKLDIVQAVRRNPLPALAIAAGAGFLFARSSRRGKSGTAAAIAGVATRASVGGVFDSVAERLFGGVADVLGQRVDGWADDLRGVIVPHTNDGVVTGRDESVVRGNRADAR